MDHLTLHTSQMKIDLDSSDSNGSPHDDSSPHTSVPAQDDLQSHQNFTSHLATEAASSAPSSAKLLSVLVLQNELRK